MQFSKILLSMALLGVTVASIAGLSSMAAPATVQQFVPAGSAAPASTQTPVAPIEANVTKDQVTSPSPVKSAKPVKPLPNAHALQMEINQLNRNALMYQQSTDSKLDSLNGKISGMVMQVQQLEQALVLLNQEVMKQPAHATTAVIPAKAAPTSISNKFETKMPNVLQQHLGQYGMYILLGIIVLVIVLFIYMLRPKSKRAKDAHQAAPLPEEDDTQDEYDYMGSDESIPAKLNLARAYIAMEDYDGAKKVLEQVVNVGNKEQREQAESLALQIKTAT